MYGANLQTIPPGVDGHEALDTVRRSIQGKDGPKRGSPEDRHSYMRSEHMCVRFLVARQWDTEKATTLLREHYEWMAEKKMDALLNDAWPEEQHIKKYYPQFFHGTDKLGRPIYIERPGLIDMPRLLQKVPPERIIDYFCMGSERQCRRNWPACSLAKGEVVDKSLNIMDLEGLGFSIVTHTIARKVVKEIITATQNHYPECMGRLIIINAPRLFSVAWSFAKPMLDEKTIRKISIFGSDKAEVSAALLEHIDEDQLPKLFGGRCMCNGRDSNSCLTSNKGPWSDPEIMELVDKHPLAEILTPAGARLLVDKRAGGSAASSVPGASASSTAPAAPAAAPVPAPPLGLDEFVAAVAAAAPAHAPATRKAGPPEITIPEPACAAQAEPHWGPTSELEKAKWAVAELLEEHRQKEEVHMLTLTQWVEEFNGLVTDIGRPIIERAQSYYDSLSLWQQTVQEYAQHHGEADRISSELEAATKELARAEEAFLAFLRDGRADEDEEAAQAFARTIEDPAVAENPKLARTLRISQLADNVTTLQWQRDAALTDRAMKDRELDEARKRFEQAETAHRGCTWNCSVKRASPFYEKRRLHENVVDAQLRQIENLEIQLQKARSRVLELQGGCSPEGEKSPTAGGMSLRSFEIEGAQPGQDEFLSCDEEESDGG